MDAGYVYIFRSGDHYKIGRSVAPEKRLASVQTSSPYPVELMAVFSTNNMTTTERALHQRFSAKRGNGEWFTLEADDVLWLQSIENIDTVKDIVPPSSVAKPTRQEYTDELNETEYLNAAQAAEYLGVSRQRVYELTEAGRIGRQIAGYWVYTRVELDAYKAERTERKGGRPKDSAGTLATVSPAVVKI